MIEKLNEELEIIPFACGPDFTNPRDAEITIANFEVVEPATRPTANYLPLILRGFSAGCVSAYTAGDPAALR